MACPYQVQVMTDVILLFQMSRADIGLRTRVSCPFNPAHVMNYSKFHNHFVQCQKRYPNDRRKSCPYNFSELIEPEQMEKHLAECEYRWDYGTTNIDDDYTDSPIKAPYNINFGKLLHLRNFFFVS